MSDSYYNPGDWNIRCDFSGFKIKRSQARKMWNGFIVDKRFWEAREQQDFVRGKKESIAAPPGETRGESEDVFITTRVLPEDL